MPPFSPTVFWDCDPASIDAEKHRAFVIGRVLTRGLFTDWQSLKLLYGTERLRDEVTRLRSLDPAPWPSAPSILTFQRRASDAIRRRRP